MSTIRGDDIADLFGIPEAKGLGKLEYEPAITERLYEGSLEGWCVEEHSIEGAGEWAGLILAPWDGLEASKLERETLDKFAGVTIEQSSAGFITTYWHETDEDINAWWTEYLSNFAEPLDGYTYAADVYCEDCGDKLKESLPEPEGYDEDNPYTWDSGDYPKFFRAEENAADYPTYCGHCEIPLGNKVHFNVRSVVAFG